MITMTGHFTKRLVAELLKLRTIHKGTARHEAPGNQRRTARRQAAVGRVTRRFGIGKELWDGRGRENAATHQVAQRVESGLGHGDGECLCLCFSCRCTTCC